MAIETWQGDPSTIDNTYGYNDMLILPGNGALPVIIQDRVQQVDVAAGSANPSTGIADAEAERLRQTGDRIFRLPNGGLLLRRSLFTDACLPSDINEDRILAMSENAARAIAYFRSGGVVSDQNWCQAPTPGVSAQSTPRLVTPFDLRSMDTVKDLKRLLGEIRAARGGTVSNSTLDAGMARTLANAVPVEELSRLESSIETRITANMNPLEWLMHKLHQLPWYVYVPADIIGTGVATAGIATVFHFVSAFWQHRGGPRPPTGGTPTGGGGGSTPVRAPAPETVQAERSMLESSTFWSGVGAFAAAAGILLLLRGRAREGEVREGAGVRTPELSFREIAARASRALEMRSPARVEVRETGPAANGFNAFDMLGAPAAAH